MTGHKLPLVCATANAEIVPLGAIPADWDQSWVELAAHASEPNPFAENWFVRAALRLLDPHADGQMLAVWHHEQLLGLLPIASVARYGRLPIHHAQNWVHFHCFYGAPLIRAGKEQVFWATALAKIDALPHARNFLHLVGLDASTTAFAALRETRQTDIVHRSERAMLHSNATPDDYFAANVRPKKRKEIRRLRARLEELGTVAFGALGTNDSVVTWTEDFLRLEASGWKGREGSAMTGHAATAAFFTEALAGAHAQARLDILRLTLDAKPIAMLVNFLTAPGSFAFKIAFDEDYARFSPGVLIKIENLKILERADILWTDSCAVEDHPMINSLWAERRQIVRVTIPLAGKRRHAMFRGARMIEKMAARVRGRQ
jgi:CelD/BcsL family acetyltransferase involved in cellulose biosynthesis